MLAEIGALTVSNNMSSVAAYFSLQFFTNIGEFSIMLIAIVRFMNCQK